MKGERGSLVAQNVEIPVYVPLGKKGQIMAISLMNRQHGLHLIVELRLSGSLGEGLIIFPPRSRHR